ncbi:hypothetical protein EB093_09650, partial [bacterium]|nr:hypothetical protein [bacterium]
AFDRARGLNIQKMASRTFDWNSDSPSKQETSNSHENKRLIKFMGNSVVPSQVRYAFEQILDMDTTNGKQVTGKEHVLKCGYSTNGTLFEKAYEQKTISKVNILLTPRELPEKHNVPSEDNILKTPYSLPFWNTPAFCYHKSAAGSKVLTKRQKNNLHSQVKFCPGGHMDRYLSGKFCAWLMGYDNEYLDYLVDY